MLSEGFTWVRVELRNCDGSAADPGSYYVRFQDGWTPSEAIVDAGLSEIPLQWAEGSAHHLRSQATLGYANTRLKQVNLVNAEVIPQDSTPPQQVTLTEGKRTSNTTPVVTKTERDKDTPQPPQIVMSQLDPQQQKYFSRLWSRIPEHLRMIRFGLDKAAWQPQDIDALGDTLCEFEHRFSKHSTDLGHVTVDPFRIVLKQDATPVKQSPTTTRQFSPRKPAPRITRFLLVGEATRIGLAPWLSSRNDKTRRLRSKALPPLASSRRESSHRELQAFCWWAKLLELGYSPLVVVAK